MSAAAQPKIKKEKGAAPASSSASPASQQKANKGEKRKDKASEEGKKVANAQPAAKAKKQEELPQEELEKVIAAVDSVHHELEQVDYELSLEVAKLESNTNKKRTPLYAKRDTLLAKIPGFWRSMLINHHMISECLEQTDTEILDSLVSLTATDFFNEQRPYTDKKTKATSQVQANGFRITLEFADGDAHVKAGKITTEIAILSLPPKPKVKKENEDEEEEEEEEEQDDADEVIITQTPTSAFRSPKFAEKHPQSFFVTWFDNAKDIHELKTLGEIMRDIYKNPLPDDEDEEGDEGGMFGGDDDEDDEDDAEDEE